MGAAEHRHIGKVPGHGAQLGDQAVQAGQQHGLTCQLELQAVAGVVDVFAGAGEVHEFSRCQQFRLAFKARLDPVLDGLHIVVGDPLEVLDGQCIGFGKVRDEALQVSACSVGQGWELLEADPTQGNEPGDFDLHAAVHEALFAHQRAQAVEPGGVAAVQRRQGGDGGGFHPRIVGCTLRL